MGGRMSRCRKGRYLHGPKNFPVSFRQAFPTRGHRSQGKKRPRDLKEFHHFAEPAGMLGLHMGEENRVHAPDGRGPNQAQRLDACTRIEQDRVIRSAFRHQIGVGDADAMGHAERPDGKWQGSNFRMRVVTAPERTETHFVKIEHRGHAPEFITGQLRAIIDRVAYLENGYIRPTRQRLNGQMLPAQCFLQHIAEFVFERG